MVDVQERDIWAELTAKFLGSDWTFAATAMFLKTNCINWERACCVKSCNQWAVESLQDQARA